MGKIVIKDKKLELKDFSGMVPNEEKNLILNTNATEVTDGEVTGKITMLHLKDVPADVTFTPADNPTDCKMSAHLPAATWRFNESFPTLPENYIGDGEFEDSFLGDLVFTQADFILSTKNDGNIKKGLNFSGTVDLGTTGAPKSNPVSWLRLINGGQNTAVFVGTIDPDANKIELVHEFAKNPIEIHSKLMVKDPSVTLFTSLEENNEIGAEGINMKGTLQLKAKDGSTKELTLVTTTPTHGFSFFGLEAYSGVDPMFLDDLVDLFGFNTGGSIVPTGMPQPGLDYFKAFVDLDSKKINTLQFKLRTGEWKIAQIQNSKGEDRFKIKDVYMDLEARNIGSGQTTDIAAEIGAIMELYEGNILVYAKYPDYEIGGRLLEGSTIKVGEMIKDVLDTTEIPDGLENLEINTLNLMINPTTKSYNFALGIGSEWKVGTTEYKLKKLGGEVDHSPENGTSFKIWGDMTIDKLDFSASVDVRKDDWKLAGHLAYNNTKTLYDLDSKAKSKIPLVLQKGGDFKLRNLDVSYGKTDGLLFDGSAFVPIKYGSNPEDQLNLDLSLHLKKQNDDFEGTFKALVDFKKLPLELDLEYKSGDGGSDKALLFKVRDGYDVSLADIVESLISKDAAEAMPNLKVKTLSMSISQKSGESVKLAVNVKLGKKAAGNDKKAKDVDKKVSDKKIKLSKSADDKSDLSLSYVQFDLAYEEGKVKNCTLVIQGKGQFNNDFYFNLLDLTYEYSNTPVESKKPEIPPVETDEDKEKTKKPVPQKVNWKIGGRVEVNAYGKDVTLGAFYSKTTEQVADKKNPGQFKDKIKKQLKLVAAGKMKNGKVTEPLIGGKDGSFQIKKIELIVDMKDDGEKKKKDNGGSGNGDNNNE